MGVLDYLGHESQLYGVEEHRLVGGKGDGMRLFLVRNGKGLEFTVSADRCADISRLSFQGVNYSHFGACGYVSPAYYDRVSTKFLDSFTCGFLTTCGLTNTGSPCVDEGEEFPLHGNISHIPAEQIYHTADEEAIRIHAVMRDARIFGRKLLLERELICSLKENKFEIRDTVKNMGEKAYPVSILYHMNLGYPLLSEEALLHIPSKRIVPRTEHAAEGLKEWDQFVPPIPNNEEQCYFHEFDQEGLAALYNPKLSKGVAIRFDTKVLDTFVQWKMLGVQDYVLGLEPGNVCIDGRDKLRREGALKYLKAGESQVYAVTVEMLENEAQWNEIKK